MKRTICTLILILITGSIFGEQIRTATMDSTLISNLRSAVTNGDPNYDEVMDFYYDKINPGSTEYGDEEDIWREEKASYEPINKASSYATQAFLGVIGVELAVYDTTYLNNAIDYLLNPIFLPDYLSLDSLWTSEFADGSWSDCLTYGSLLNNIAFIVDMLWYYVTPAEQDSLYSKLDELAGWAYELLNDTEFEGGNAYCTNPDYPPKLGTSFHNGRIRLAGALGYSGCILNSISYIQTAEDNLFDWDVPGDVSGFLPFMTSNSGTYSEGMSYTEYTFEGLAKFFVARKRLYGIDWFEDERVKSIYVNSLDLIAPNMSWIPFDDVHITCNKYWGNHYLYSPKQSFSEMVTYFYHSPDYDQESRNHIKWIINSYQAHSGYVNYYFASWNVNKFYAYNSDRTLSGIDTTPEHLNNGTYSNKELTILRRSIQTYSDYENYPILIVNHEKSADHTTHEHSDQSSFILYYKDKQLLIDPGYRPSWWNYNIAKEWLVSPFAHNLIMVNPHSSFYNDDQHWEESELLQDYWDPLPNYSGQFDVYTITEYWNDIGYDNEGQQVDLGNPNNYDLYEYGFEPIGKSGGYDDEIAKNPANKQFLIQNDEIQHLQVEIEYDHPQGAGHYPPNKINDTLSIKRNFYSLDIEEENPYFIIFDEISSSDHSISNEFMNQLHFALYPVPVNNNEYPNDPDSIDNPNQQEGKFTYTYFDNSVKLFGAMGSQSNSTWTVLDNLPQGLYWGKNWMQGSFEPPQWEHKCLRIKTTNVFGDEKFLTVLIPTESGSNPITVNNDYGYYAVDIYDAAKTPTEKSYYAVSDTILDISFDDIDIYSDAAFVGLTYRPGYQFDTKITQFIMADGNILFYNAVDTLVLDPNSCIDEIIASYSGTELSAIVKSDNEYPKYRILRQGVEPEDFTSIGVADGENGQSNIQHFWGDDEYFYVNYDFTSGYYNINTSVYIPEGDTLVIGNGVTINCMNSDIKIEIEGVTSIGDSVTFTSPDSVYWDGLYLLNTSETITMNNVTFERCKLYNDSRSLMISNSEFNNSGIEQSGSKINVSETNFNSSNIFCERLNSCESEDMDEVYITGCEFINFSDYYAVSISTYPTYNLSDNEISNCFAGFRIVESGHPKMCVITDNIIRWNTNGVGICIYHSYADISGHNRIIGNLVGILGAKDSSIKINGDIDYPYQSINDNIYEEIVTDCYSFPHRKGISYNEIVDDEYIEGTRDQYLFVCKDATGAQRELNVEYNYWGQESLEWEEGDGDDRFYPAESFDYIPVWDPGVPESPEMSAPELLYADADSFIQIEEYEQAKIVYRDIIQLYPESKFAIFSMRNLLPMETVSGQNFSSLQQYYLTEPNCNINDERTKLSQYLANYCAIKMEQYPEAISFFEDIISDPDTELDSVYAVIDAGYTYLLMENGGKSGYIGKMAELKPKSEMEFRIMSDNLLSELFEIIQTEPEEPHVEYTFELKHNYPNPFNSSTTISFSLPLYTQKAELKIYNIRGQLVRELDINAKSGIGSIAWDGRDSYGKQVGSGVYFYKLTSDKKEIVKKMVLMR